MTEKRFTVHIDWFNYDKTEGEATLKDYGQPLLESECVEDMRTVKELLNEQHKTIQQLKQQLRIFEDGLKSEIKETKIAMEDWHECLTDCRKLKEENEQLRKQNQELIQGIQETARLSANAITKTFREEKLGKGVDYD